MRALRLRKMAVENEDFRNNEKTFYPPEKLDVISAPSTDGRVRVLEVSFLCGFMKCDCRGSQILL